VTAARNLISGNTFHGVWITNLNTRLNRVQGNFIGTNAAGTAAIPNGGDGVIIDDTADDNIIGSDTAGGRNLISGNRQNGVHIGDDQAATTVNNVVRGNYIGTNVSGTAAVPNARHGVRLDESAESTGIGGTTGTPGAAPGNLISGNRDDGVALLGGDENLLHGNAIGTNAAGSGALPNGLAGVEMVRARLNVIGSTAAGGGNRIAFNALDGVLVAGTSSFSNSIRGNQIYSNGRLGINLHPDGEPLSTITPNDSGDNDIGPNDLQNYPTLGTVRVTGSTTTITGSLNSTPNTSFILDFYRSPGADPSGYGEGQTFVASFNVTTDGSGFASFDVSIGASFTGQFFSATATRNQPGLIETSEFSQAVKAVATTAASATTSSASAPHDDNDDASE
jgi:Right handed beta helix region